MQLPPWRGAGTGEQTGVPPPTTTGSPGPSLMERAGLGSGPCGPAGPERDSVWRGGCVLSVWREPRACGFAGLVEGSRQSLPSPSQPEQPPIQSSPSPSRAGRRDAGTHPHGSSRTPEGPRELMRVFHFKGISSPVEKLRLSEVEWPVDTSRKWLQGAGPIVHLSHGPLPFQMFSCGTHSSRDPCGLTGQPVPLHLGAQSQMGVRRVSPPAPAWPSRAPATQRLASQFWPSCRGFWSRIKGQREPGLC